MYDILDITPEPMTAEDLDEVLSIEAVSFPTPWSRQMFLDELAHRHSRLIVFRESGQIVGYMCFWQVLDEAHLFNIAVADTKRGRGIGFKIMQHLEEICRGNGMNRIILEVARRNSAARALYKKAGFNSVGFRKKYYAVVDDDAFVMEKWLGNQTESAPQNSEEIAR
ncbi:ribosomal protein S18-alanine N-acetyltransferase [Desulfomonile tiedjei]|uniref:Ribosomal-protein-alanine acetyltransferase n=1 Tax=Desulfomonile tiedjei (strain ATCC 49306 / DSM 6799 / DCB-1) TaxID=706587 RepID=I4C2R3_DESTA|nr:ribosomal protein S18-alanine N-acetyltransferase [Desulfomonile tiedjei]AFM23854.1 ribosomal-protein-alanine acetyltransferase [Desulfomonile tiedjei DSM 6799]